MATVQHLCDAIKHGQSLDTVKAIVESGINVYKSGDAIVLALIRQRQDVVEYLSNKVS